MAQARQRDASSIPATRRSRPRTTTLAAPAPEKEVEDVAEISAQGAYGRIMEARVDAVDKDLGMSAILGRQPIMSTNVLAFDLAQGAGGLMPGLHVVFGGEGSAKSTMEMKIMGASLAHDIPVRGYYDAEGALDRRYTSQVIRTDDFESIFGDRDASGRWVRPPLVRYYDSNIMEEVFGSMHHILRQMPDKGYSERLGCWMLRFDKTRPQQVLMNELYKARVISEPHKKLFSSTGLYWCETDNASPQAIF